MGKPWGPIYKSPVASSVPYDPNSDPECDLTSEDVQEAIDELCNRIGAVGGISTILLPFTEQGNTSDKWLSLSGSFASSDLVQGIISHKATFIGLIYNNQSSNSNTDIEIYRNGTAPANLFHVRQIRNKKWACVSNKSVQAQACDQFSIFLKKITGSPNPVDPLVYILFKVDTDAVPGESEG